MRLLRLLSPVLLLLCLVPGAMYAQQAAPPQKVTITKCQDCQNKAANSFKACQAGGGGAACATSYQKKTAHCQKKWCSPKTTKVKVQSSH